MKKYNILYSPLSGLKQPTQPITAYCYSYKDNFFHFYDSQQNVDQNRPFRSINFMSILSIDEVFETKT